MRARVREADHTDHLNLQVAAVISHALTDQGQGTSMMIDEK